MQEEKPITAVVKVEIVKPLSGDWAELSDRLFDLSGEMHRVMNSALSAVVLSAARGEEKAKNAALAAIKEQLQRDREWAASKLKSDSPPWMRRLATIELPSIISDACATKAWQAFLRWRKGAWKGETSLPSFTAGSPILIRDRGWSVSEDDRGRFELELKLDPKGHRRVAVHADGGHAIATMRQLVALPEGWKLCNAQIIRAKVRRRDGEHGKRWAWMAYLTYQKPRTQRAAGVDPTRAVAVHGGIRNLITMATSDGTLASSPIDSGAFLATKAGFRARRQSIGRHLRTATVGAGSRGHGRKRRLKALLDLEDKEARWVKSTCQQWAAHVVKVAVARGCGTIVLENYSPKEMADSAEKENETVAKTIREVPFAMFRDAIRWAALKESLDVVEAESAYNSVTCPKCGNVDADNDNGRGKFVCHGCALEADVDRIAAWNMLRGAGFGGFHEANARAKRGAKKLRKEVAAAE